MTTTGNNPTNRLFRFKGSYLLNMTTIGKDYLNLYKAKFGPYLLNVTTIVSIIYHYLSFIMVLTYLIWQTSETLFYFSTNSHPGIYLLEMSTIVNTIMLLILSLTGSYLLNMTTIVNRFVVKLF